MRRILATSIAAAIPALLPVSSVEALSKPPQPPTASGHSRARAHGHGRIGHGRPASSTANEPGNRPENDVKVDADDGGNQAEPAGAPDAAPERGPVRAHGQHATHARPAPARPARHRPAARPGTGADSGFADSDDLVLPPEAAAAIQEADELQHSAGQQAGPPQGAAPAAPGSGPAAAPQAPAAPAAPAAPVRPRTGRGAARPQNPVSDESTNQSSGHRATRTAPRSFFNGVGKPAQGSRLVLHTTAGASPARTVTLQCFPTGGTHPNAAAACADVMKAGGDLAHVPAPAPQRACFMIYSPVTVTAQGQWRGQNVRYTKQFPNTCVMRDKTGSVFDF
jgi:hypothetical protein